MVFWASPGPGVAGNGFSAKNDGQFRGRGSNPSPGDTFRGQFSFLKVTPRGVPPGSYSQGGTNVAVGERGRWIPAFFLSVFRFLVFLSFF